MSTKMTKIQQIQKLTAKCKNQNLVDELIEKFQQETKSAVLHTLNMCETVYEMHMKVKNKELSKEDLQYFCLNVRLDQNGSTYRKYIRIAQHADQFRQYLDKLPAAYSVLYEITTLEPNLFEAMLTSGEISNETTLHELKKLVGKNHISGSNGLVSFTVCLDPNKVTDETKTLLQQAISLLKDVTDVKFLVPKHSGYFFPADRLVPSVNK